MREPSDVTWHDAQRLPWKFSNGAKRVFLIPNARWLFLKLVEHHPVNITITVRVAVMDDDGDNWSGLADMTRIGTIVTRVFCRPGEYNLAKARLPRPTR